MQKEIAFSYRGSDLLISVQGDNRRVSVVVTEKDMADNSIVGLCIIMAERFNYFAEKLEADLRRGKR